MNLNPIKKLVVEPHQNQMVSLIGRMPTEICVQITLQLTSQIRPEIVSDYIWRKCHES